MRESVFYLTGKEPLVAELVRRTFPRYKGRTFILQISDAPIDFHETTEGVIREFYVCDLVTLESRRVKAEQRAPRKLPPNIVAVEKRIERDVVKGLTIHVRPRDVRPELKPTPVELTADEQIVLRYTARYAASHGGNVRYRQWKAKKDTGITEDRWNAARETLKARDMIGPNNMIKRFGLNQLT